ncbi:DUF2256 domain-containing protein [Cnuibacter sp. UC19_7]|uniref:DUF2256 domain-containing protein n=1 Tax=Cnuibacter sp. UC19_7 TaxID=3350166 RepID=UPI003670E4C7
MGRTRSGASRPEREGPGSTKVCESCGRAFAWRAKWAQSWDDVRYCSDACRRRGVTEHDRELERRLLDELRHAPRRAIVDLDAVTEAMSTEAREPGGSGASREREGMRRAARRLVAQGRAEMVQSGRTVDPSTARGRVGVRLTARAQRI